MIGFERDNGETRRGEYVEKTKKILVGRMIVAVVLIAAYLVMALLDFYYLEAGPVFFVLIAAVMFVPLPGSRRAKEESEYSSVEG